MKELGSLTTNLKRSRVTRETEKEKRRKEDEMQMAEWVRHIKGAQRELEGATFTAGNF